MSSKKHAADGRSAHGRRGPVGGAPAKRHAAPPDTVVVNGYSEEWLKKGFPWVYEEEIVGAGEGLDSGAVVRIASRTGECLGRGIVGEGKVRVRRFRSDEGPIDGTLLGDRLAQALRRRRLPPDTDAYRAVHGENDGLPGIRIDVWGDALGVVLDSPSLQGLVDPLLDSGVLPFARATLLARGKGEGAAGRWIRGEPVDEQVVSERGIRFAVRPADGQDPGLYCDMRDVRAWMAPHWSGRRVLNTFAHTGAFSVASALGGAAHVTQVDLSAAYTERARANFSLNGLDPSTATFLTEDVFKALDRLRRANERFDCVVLDPPVFSTGPQGPWSIEKDYGTLVAQALRVLDPGGWIIAAVHHGGVSPRQFQQFLLDGARRAGVELRLLHQGSPPLDFPAALSFPESRYLKVWILEARP